MSQIYEQFGKYLLLEKVATGGMAEIYLAKSNAANGLNKFFAIKRILPQFTNNEDFVSMFKEEAKVCINLNHSNVVSIFDFGIEQGQFYLVMDFVEGRNLRQIINELKKTNKSFSIDQALYLVKEAAAGLDHAHRCTDSMSGKPLNITHRDMSPQNVMVSYEGEIKVIDFGIAKAETEAEDTKAGTLKGKFSYMSPEQAEGQPIDPRTDVFALGIVLWELLANDRLFTGSNEAAILRKVRDCQVPQIRKINPTVPQELERIVMKALAKDRNLRYQTAANFQKDLNRFLNTQYPDFSPQDFSQFIKECFKDAFAEAREKLIAYSKVAAESVPVPIAPPKVTVAAVPPTPLAALPVEKLFEKNQERAVPPPAPVPEKVDLPPAGLNSEANLRVNLEDLRQAGATPAKNFPNYYQKAPNQTRVTQISQISYNKKSKARETSSGDVIFKLAFLGLLVFGGFWGYKNVYLTGIGKPVPVKKQKGQEDWSSKAPPTAPEIKISITSSPDGAEIILNGKSTGFKTPGVLTLPAGKDSEIKLRKEGFLDYTINRKFNETSPLAATLQSNVSAAYLNIKLTGADSFTKIRINGKEILEKPPVLKYPIVAQRETVISAYNPITKLTAEKTIIAKPDELVDVELSLAPQRK
jgi:serine/threonine-protein kinase